MASFFHGTGTGGKRDTVRKRHQTPVRLWSIGGQACCGLVRELFGEYLREHDRDVRRDRGVGLDAEAVLERDMGKLGEFGPPAADGVRRGWGTALGCCLRRIGEGTGAVKRTYAGPEAGAWVLRSPRCY